MKRRPLLFLRIRRPSRSTPTDTHFPYKTLFRALRSLRPRPRPNEPVLFHRRVRCRRIPQEINRTWEGEKFVNYYRASDRHAACGSARTAAPHRFRRSEEHTSELQSLMRISYAVFCLKKKKQQHTRRQSHT